MNKIWTFFTHLLIISLLFWSCDSSSKKVNSLKMEQLEDKMEHLDSMSVNKFNIRKGTNISHWLSQSTKRGKDRFEWFTFRDVEFIANKGYDHIRLPIDEEQLWDENGNKKTEAFELLHNAIKWCDSLKLKVIVDLHIIRSHHFNENSNTLFTNPKEQEKLLGLWLQLSEELSKYSNSFIAYELMNEAVADSDEDWNKLIALLIPAIRAKEPNRFIVVGSNKWQNVFTFKNLKLPAVDKYIILSFHYYLPMALTHYKASWTKVGEYTGQVKYPGVIVEEKDMKGLPVDLVEVLKQNNTFNRDSIEKHFELAIIKAKELNLPLYCGEWGCLPSVPRKDRLQWYTDMRDILNKHNIAWAHWDYKGSFGIVDNKTMQPDEEFINILMGGN